MRFVLASASPARLATLRTAGIEPEVLVSGFDEDSIRATEVGVLVQKLADIKARTVAQRISGAALVLGCDSLLEFEGEAMGKPASADEARARWRRIRGRSGTLITGHCLIDTGADRVATATVSTRVHFAEITDDELEIYVGSGEPLAVAGAFTLDGLGGWFVTGVEGDHHSVVGLSLPTLRIMLHELGYALADIGYPNGG